MRGAWHLRPICAITMGPPKASKRTRMESVSIIAIRSRIVQRANLDLARLSSAHLLPRVFPIQDSDIGGGRLSPHCWHGEVWARRVEVDHAWTHIYRAILKRENGSITLRGLHPHNSPFAAQPVVDPLRCQI